MQIISSPERKLLSLVVGASAAMVALTTLAFAFTFRGLGMEIFGNSAPIWILLSVSSAATLLVMGTLHSHLSNLYRALSQSQSAAWADARSDALTGLANRTLLLERLDGVMRDREGRARAVLYFLDLDQFKRVNDTLGHHVGDELIQAVAKRLANSIPQGTVARIGGDEFAVLLDAETSAQTARYGELIVRSLSGKYEVGDSLLSVGVSVGASRLSTSGDLSSAMRQADIAMYSAKASGGGFKLFDNGMSAQIERRAIIERRLMEVLDTETVAASEGAVKSSLSTVFQPVFDDSGRIVSAETLLRWNDDETGLVSPCELITIAEDAHVIGEVGLLVARSALECAQQIEDLPISINVSQYELLDPYYPDRLAALADKFEVAHGRIQLEISERTMIERGPTIDEALAGLRKLGFVIVVDDFGSTMASANHLSMHEIAVVKLDHSLLAAARKSGNVAILKALVRLVMSHGYAVVCENVADEEDQAIAHEAGCTQFQGFYHSRPLLMTSLAQLVEETKNAGTGNGPLKLIA